MFGFARRPDVPSKLPSSGIDVDSGTRGWSTLDVRHRMMEPGRSSSPTPVAAGRREGRSSLSSREKRNGHERDCVRFAVACRVGRCRGRPGRLHQRASIDRFAIGDVFGHGHGDRLRHHPPGQFVVLRPHQPGDRHRVRVRSSSTRPSRSPTRRPAASKSSFRKTTTGRTPTPVDHGIVFVQGGESISRPVAGLLVPPVDEQHHGRRSRPAFTNGGNQSFLLPNGVYSLTNRSPSTR